MIEVGSPGQRGGPVDGLGPARAKTCRPDAANHDAGSQDVGDRACAASACMAYGAGGRAFATACCASSVGVAGAGAPKPGIKSGRMYGLSHHCSPHGGRPARNRATLPPNATMARDRSGQFGCPGPMPWRRHIRAIANPNWPRTDAASASAEPGGRSGRSFPHDDTSRPWRCMRMAFKGSRRQKISRASQRSHSGDGARTSGPARSA